MLLIDTCTERGIFALVDHNRVIFEHKLPPGINQSNHLMPMLSEALKGADFSPGNLDVIGVGIGPGSYTGIRLGVAVAQTLSYAWKIPLAGFSSLNGFVPEEYSVHFAAILDARIGGVYLQKGFRDEIRECILGIPEVYTLEEAGKVLQTVTHLVTSSAKTLQAKLSQHYPDHLWIWSERPPSIQQLVKSVERLMLEGRTVCPPEKLELLYLRKTEAEREKANRLNQ